MRLIIFFISIFFIILFLKVNCVEAKYQPDPKPGELNRVSDYKKNKGTMGNVENLYINAPVASNSIKNSRQFLSHDLIFPIYYKGYNEVKTELESSELARKYIDKKVDVFGIPYFYTCIVPKDRKEKNIFGGVCMYGGLTENQSENRQPYVITVRININGQLQSSFTIYTDKKEVTAQELDYKVRNWLTIKKKLYQTDGSAFETGYIKFIEKNGNSFWYDFFSSKNLIPFIPYKFLSIYGDNKTVDSSNIKIETYLTTL